jgi:hypothetical protein
MREHWRVYTEADFETLGFHDCHVHAIGWDFERFRFKVDLDYIVEWVNPSQQDDPFRFRISRASLDFNNIDELCIDLHWKNAPASCQLAALDRAESRQTPNGAIQWRWVMDFQSPSGEIAFWATGFSLTLLHAPSISERQTLPSYEREGREGVRL